MEMGGCDLDAKNGGIRERGIKHVRSGGCRIT